MHFSNYFPQLFNSDAFHFTQKFDGERIASNRICYVYEEDVDLPIECQPIRRENTIVEVKSTSKKG